MGVQELHEADLAASVAQEQLVHERQRTGRLKQAIKSAFEDARTPAVGITGGSEYCWRTATLPAFQGNHLCIHPRCM